MLEASEAVECAEAVTLSELTFEVATDVDVTVVVELATYVDAIEVTAATLDASEFCLAVAVEAGAGAETVELGVSISDASPPKISATVSG